MLLFYQNILSISLLLINKMASNERMRAARLAKYRERVNDRKRWAEILREEREKEEEKKKPVRDETLPVGKTSIPSRNPREVIASHNRHLRGNDKQVYDVPGAYLNINNYIDQPGFTINIDCNIIRKYNSRMYRGYRRRQYPFRLDRITCYIHEIPVDWIPMSGNKLLQQIVQHYTLLSREEFKSWVVRNNWFRNTNYFEPIILTEQERTNEIPSAQFEQEFQETTNIRLEKIRKHNGIPQSKDFAIALLDKGNDLIPGFTGTYLDENGSEYDLVESIHGTWYWGPRVSEERKQQRRRQAIAQDKLIEKLYLAFFKDLSHWIIFILCKINNRKVEPVPIQNYIISGCLPQHIVKNRETEEQTTIKSDWCYHIKSNINLFDRAFRGQKNTTKEYYRDVTYKEYKAAKKAIAKREAQRNGKPWVKRLMNDDINLKF